MIERHHSRCSFESLENRRLLAVTLSVDGKGVLHEVSTADGAQTDGLTLTVQPDNKLNVMEGAADLGTFKVGRSLAIELGNTTGGFVDHLDLNNNTLDTNLKIAMGDTQGLDQFRITTGDNGVGTIDGNVSFSSGDGSQFLLFGDFGQPAPRTINITGNLHVDMGGGGDQNSGAPDAVATAGTAANNTILNVGRNMEVENATVLALRGSVGGNLSSDSEDKAFDQLVILGNFSEPFTVGKNVEIETGNGADEVDVQAVSIKGNLEIESNGGNDTIKLDTDVDLTGTIPTHVGKNVEVDAGAGNDTVYVSGLIANKNVEIQLGEGDDTLKIADNATVQAKHIFADGGDGTDTYIPGAGNNIDIKLVNFE